MVDSFAKQRDRNEAQRQARLKKKRSSGSSKSSELNKLMAQGIPRAEASQILLAQSKGQKITNVQTLSTQAQEVVRSRGLEAKPKRRLTPSTVAEIRAGKVQRLTPTQMRKQGISQEQTNIKKRLIEIGYSVREAQIESERLARAGLTGSRLNFIISKEQLKNITPRSRLNFLESKARLEFIKTNKPLIKKVLLRAGFTDKEATEQASRYARFGYLASEVQEILRRQPKDTIVTEFVSETKPIFTVGTALRILGKDIINPQDVKIYKNSKGEVIGVEDKFTGQSYRIKPASESLVKRKIKEKSLEREYFLNIQRIKEIDRRTSQKVISAKKRLKGTYVSEFLKLEPLSQKLINVRAETRQKRIQERLKDTPYEKTLPTVAKLLGATIGSAIIDTAKGVTDLPETVYAIARNPLILKNLPSAIKQSAEEFGILIRTSPEEALVRIGAEIYLAKGLGSVLDDIGRLSRTTLARISPYFVGKAKIGKVFKIKGASGKISELEIVGKIPKQTIKQQLNLAGKTVNAISSQADSLIGFLKSRSKTIRKPIPNEGVFSKKTLSLLKKFDNKKISKKELFELNRRIIKEGSKGLLERSFFADPTGKIRPSRLGLVDKKGASLFDFVTGDISFRRQKPQILFFENVKVQKFPAYLEDVVKKLKRGSPLSKNEANLLLNYQLQKTGKFKPLGFLSGESELTLAPDEIITRVKKVGVSIINGESVPLIQVKVVKVKGKLRSALRQLREGTLSPKKVPALDKALKRKTGLNYGLSKYVSKGKYVNLKSMLSSVLIKASSKFIRNIYSNLSTSAKRYVNRSKYGKSIPKSLKKSSVKASPKKTSVKKSSKKVSPKKSPKKISVKRSPKKSSPTSSKSGTSRTSPKKSPKKGASSKSPRKVSKLAPKKVIKAKKIKLSWDKKAPRGYSYVVEARVRSKGRNIVVAKTTPNRALRVARKLTDNTLSRSMELRIIGLKKVKDIAKPSLTKFRLKKSKNSQVLKVVERSKYAIDRRGEKSGLSIARYIKQRKTLKSRVKNLNARRVTKRRVVKRKVVRRKIKPKTKRKVVRKKRAIKKRRVRKKR